MAVYNVQAPDGSIIKLDGPDNATDEQIIQAAQVAFSQKKPETTAAGTAGAVTRGLAPVTGGATLGAVLGAPIAGVGAVPGALIGGGVGALTPVVGDPAVRLVNKAFGTNFTEPSQAIENLLDRLGVAKPKSETEKIIQSSTAAASSIASPVAIGQVMTKSASPFVAGVGKTLAEKPALQAVSGGAGAAASEKVQQEGGDELTQLAAGLGAGLAAGGIASRVGAKPKVIAPQALSPEQEMVNLAKSEGVDLLTSNVRKPESYVGKRAQDLAQKIPLGTQEQWKTLQEQRQGLASKLLKDLDVQPVVADDIAQSLSDKRLADFQKYAGMKREVIDRYADQKITPKNTAQAFDDAIADLTRKFGNKDKEAASLIKDFQSEKKKLQNIDVLQLDAFRSQLGKKYEAPNLAERKSLADKYIGNIYDKVRSDIYDHIGGQNARDLTKVRIADRAISTDIAESKTGLLRRYLKEADIKPDNVIKLVKSTSESDLDIFNRSISQAGRKKAADYLLTDIKDSATDFVGGKEIVNPDRFLRGLNKYEMQLGKLLPKDDAKRIDGIRKIIEVTKDASRIADMPQTGVQAVPFLAGSVLTDILGGWGAATATALGTGTAARVYESKAARDLLLKLGNAKKGSFEEDKVLRQLFMLQAAQGEK
jgi:hypothetical protein